MKLLKNMTYNCILDYKYDYVISLNKMIEDGNSNIEVPAKVILSLFLIDYENANLREYNEEEMKRVYKYYSAYEEDENASFEFTPENLNKLIMFSKKARVSIDFNVEIATIFAEMHKEDTKYDLLYEVDIEAFRLWCKNLLIEDEVIQ